MKVAIVVLGSVVLLAGGTPARAGQEASGTTAAAFLANGHGAATLAMGGAALARGGSLELVSWNAASLGSLGGGEIALSSVSVPEGATQAWAALGGRMGETRWALSGLYRGEDGFEGRDAGGLSTGSFSVASMALAAHVARPIGGIVTAGLGARFVSEKLGDVAGAGVTFDAGLQARAGVLRLGIAAQNLGGEMKYDGQGFAFPSNWGAGVAAELPAGVTLAADWNSPDAYVNDLRVGAEWRWRDRVALRGGWRQEMGAPVDESLSGPSFGMGAGMGALWVDYGYVLQGENDGEHRIGLRFRPGMGGAAAPRETAPRAERTLDDAARDAAKLGEK